MDDLKEIAKLEEYVDMSALLLMFLSKGYFASKHCLREASRIVDHSTAPQAARHRSRDRRNARRRVPRRV